MVTTQKIILDDQFSSPAGKVIKSLISINKELNKSSKAVKSISKAVNSFMKMTAKNANKAAIAVNRLSRDLSKASQATITQTACEQNLQQTLKKTKTIYDKNKVSIKKHNLAVEKNIKYCTKQSKVIRKLAHNAQKAHKNELKQIKTNVKISTDTQSSNNTEKDKPKTFKEKLKSSLQGFKGKALKVLKSSIKQAANLTKQFVMQSINAAKIQVAAENQLQDVLKKTKGITDKQIAGLNKYNSSLQKQSVISKEVSLAGISQLGTYKLQASTIKSLMPGMQDLLAQQKGFNATQQDSAEIGDMIGQVMNGQFDALSQVGISFNAAQQKILKFGTESQKAAVVAGALKDKVGGVNKKLANTDEGKIINAKNAWRNMQAEVGKRLLPVLANLYQWFGSKIPKIQAIIIGILDKIKEIIAKSKPQLESLKSIFGFILNKAAKIFSFISENWSAISPIIFAIVGAMATFKLATLAQIVFTKALTVAMAIKKAALIAGVVALKAIAIAQWAWNAAMTANPIGLVIAGVVALIAVGALIIKNWSKIKETGAKLWEGLKSGVRGFANFFIKIWNWIIGKLNKFKIKIPKWVPGIGGKTFGFNLKEAKLLTSPQKKVLNEESEEITTSAYSNQPTAEVSAPQPINSSINTDQVTAFSKPQGENIQIVFKGDVYGFEDFKNRVSQAFVEVYKANRPNIVTV